MAIDPRLVFVQYVNNEKKELTNICGGLQYHKNFVLTAPELFRTHILNYFDPRILKKKMGKLHYKFFRKHPPKVNVFVPIPSDKSYMVLGAKVAAVFFCSICKESKRSKLDSIFFIIQIGEDKPIVRAEVHKQLKMFEERLETVSLPFREVFVEESFNSGFPLKGKVFRGTTTNFTSSCHAYPGSPVSIIDCRTGKSFVVALAVSIDTSGNMFGICLKPLISQIASPPINVPLSLLSVASRKSFMCDVLVDWKPCGTAVLICKWQGLFLTSFRTIIDGSHIAVQFDDGHTEPAWEFYNPNWYSPVNSYFSFVVLGCNPGKIQERNIKDLNLAETLPKEGQCIKYLNFLEPQNSFSYQNFGIILRVFDNVFYASNAETFNGVVLTLDEKFLGLILNVMPFNILQSSDEKFQGENCIMAVVASDLYKNQAPFNYIAFQKMYNEITNYE